MIENLQSGSDQACSSMGASLENVNEVKTQVEHSKAMFEDILSYINTIYPMTEQVSSAIQEQSVALSEMSSNVEIISDMADVNEKCSSEILNNSQELSEISEGLQNIIDQFKIRS